MKTTKLNHVELVLVSGIITQLLTTRLTTLSGLHKLTRLSLLISQAASWYRVAPEHVRALSTNEQLVAQGLQDLGAAPIQASGVFQYQDQTETPPPENRRVESNPLVPEIIVPEPSAPSSLEMPENPSTNRPESIGSQQLDDEPEINSNRPRSPPENTLMPEASQIPVPDDDDDSLVADAFEHDHWQIAGNLLIRHHRVPRLRTFNPCEDNTCPVPMQCLGLVRETKGIYRSGEPTKSMNIGKIISLAMPSRCMDGDIHIHHPTGKTRTSEHA